MGQRSPVQFTSPPAYLLHQLGAIEHILMTRADRNDSRQTNVVYNALVRHVTTYDHGPNADAEGWSTDGTLLKIIGLLPYLHRMGIGTLAVLPIFERGVVGRKGDRGSPYAIRHPLRLDHTLVEPALGMSADDVFRALVAACHALDIKIVVEFALRTASIDSDLVPHHPEWFYWVREEAVLQRTFTAPAFDAELIALATSLVADRSFKHLPEPDDAYRELFTGPPLRVRRDEHGWLGITASGSHVRIPGAFADWPPDDPQPSWSDVTYLRLHEHPHYRYMAYNTIRYYEYDLDLPERRIQGLWNLIAGVIPHYIRMFGIDGAMIDMGHALPADLQRRVVTEARALKPGFILWEENFHLQSTSVASGYDAVVGYLPFDMHDPSALRAFIDRIAADDVPVRYFAAAETHNTPRAASRQGGMEFVLGAWTMLHCLPRGIPYLHAGMEMGETVPVNTGLGFTNEEIAALPVDRLPLFSRAALPWDTTTENIQRIALVHERLASSSWFHTLRDDDAVLRLDLADEDVVGMLRRSTNRDTGICVIFNMSQATMRTAFTMPASIGRVVIAPDDHIEFHAASNTWSIVVDPWECVVLPTWHARPMT